MVAEVKILPHLDQIVLILGVLVPQVLQNLELHQRLVVKPLLVPNHLHRHRALRLVVVAAHHLPEAPFPGFVDDLEPIRQVVAGAHHVVPAVVVVPVVIHPARLLAPYLLSADPREVHARVLQDLRPFQRGERGAVLPESDLRRDALDGSFSFSVGDLSPVSDPFGGSPFLAASPRAVRRIPALLIGAPSAYAARRVPAVVRRRSAVGHYRGQSQRGGELLLRVSPPRSLPSRGRRGGYRATARRLGARHERRG